MSVLQSDWFILVDWKKGFVATKYSLKLEILGYRILH